MYYYYIANEMCSEYVVSETKLEQNNNTVEITEEEYNIALERIRAQQGEIYE